MKLPNVADGQTIKGMAQMAAKPNKPVPFEAKVAFATSELIEVHDVMSGDSLITERAHIVVALSAEPEIRMSWGNSNLTLCPVISDLVVETKE